MLQVHQLDKFYGAATIFSDVSFVVNDGEHVGLIGPNGAGKSTLIRCIVGAEQPDRGTVTRPPHTTIGYLAQSFDEQLDQTIAAVIAAAQAAFTRAEQRLQRASAALVAAKDLDGAMAEYDAALAAFEVLGGYEREHRAAAVLQGLGLGELASNTPVATLSGGQKTRLGLVTLLLREPDVLLLDEPTNHLDSEALEWLETFVQSYPRAALIVSHDREFLDRTVSRVLYLDGETRTVKSYTGNYSGFVAARQHEHEAHAEAWTRQQEYVARVQADITRMKGQAQRVEGAATPKGEPDAKYILDSKGRSAKVARKAKARERKLERYLASDERVEKPRQPWGLRLDFGEPPPGGQAVLRVEDVSFAYPTASTLLHGVTFDVQQGERIALVGPNGAGKTTLLRLLAGDLQPINGRVRLGTNIRPGVLAQEHETLDPQRTVLATILHERAMPETEARTLLHFFLFGGDAVFRQVGACSFGERTRLQLAVLVVRGCNLLLLDEPLNQLDIEGREHFTAALAGFAGTVVAVSHDRTFVREFAERVLVVGEGGVALG